MLWFGANSFHARHSPCPEELLELADQQGIVVIQQSPAAGLTKRSARDSAPTFQTDDHLFYSVDPPWNVTWQSNYSHYEL